MPGAPLLSLSGMTKSFPGVLANDRVELALEPGQIHALLGENGAGKSTLVKLLCGVLKPDAGSMAWQGRPVTIASPAAARRLGIATVFQNFSLFESLSVLENIALSMAPGSDHRVLARQIVDLSARYGLPLEPGRYVHTLSVGERQRLETVRCLLQNPKLLIMDEPTSVLTPQEVTALFATLRRLADAGVAILYISHKLDEIKALCGKATILRGGRVVASVAVAAESAASLAAQMMGRELDTAPRAGSAKTGQVRLAVRGLSCPAPEPFGIALKDVSFKVRAGEIVGIAGVAGNGQDELLQALNGETAVAANGALEIDGSPCGRAGANRRRAMGLASIPEQRLGHGAVPAMSLVENTLLTAFRRPGLVRAGFIDYGQCRSFCAAVIAAFKVRCNGIDAAAVSLSGGNLQKFIVGREISQSPGVLVVAQPTWGVDAGAAQTIHQALRRLAAGGAAILVISQDLDELLRLSDRIAALCAGALTAAVDTAQVSIEQLGLMMAGARQTAAAAGPVGPVAR